MSEYYRDCRGPCGGGCDPNENPMSAGYTDQRAHYGPNEEED